MRLALNEDLEEDEEEVLMEEEELEENAAYKVFIIFKSLNVTSESRCDALLLSGVCRVKTGLDRTKTAEAPY